MKRRPCLCGHDKSAHQSVEVKITPKPCVACGCPHYRAATRKRIADLAAQRRLFEEPVKPKKHQRRFPQQHGDRQPRSPFSAW